MRIWSIHPKYLDTKGLLALWRETLLAQAVLSGKTAGYRNHPQLIRFRDQNDPLTMIGRYLLFVYAEAKSRDYNFDRSKIHRTRSTRSKILVTDAQLEYEFLHLKRKLRERDHERYRKLLRVDRIESHPIFKSTPGSIEPWEVVR